MADYEREQRLAEVEKDQGLLRKNIEESEKLIAESEQIIGRSRYTSERADA